MTGKDFVCEPKLKVIARFWVPGNCIIPWQLRTLNGFPSACNKYWLLLVKYTVIPCAFFPNDFKLLFCNPVVIGWLIIFFQAMQKAGVNVFPAVDAEKYVSINSKVFLSNRPQVSVVYSLINPTGCWKNTRRICKSRAAGEWFMNSSSVLPTSHAKFPWVYRHWLTDQSARINLIV